MMPIEAAEHQASGFYPEYCRHIICLGEINAPLKEQRTA
jgi:hypothetical protein